MLFALILLFHRIPQQNAIYLDLSSNNKRNMGQNFIEIGPVMKVSLYLAYVHL